jgi:subtilisin family serine protease
MKRLMLFFVFFAGITARAFSQSDFFYANGGERVYFKFKKDRVILRAKSATEAKSLSPQSGFLSGYNVDEKIIISTIDTLQVRLEDFKQKTDFTDVAYALEYEDGIFQYPSYQIFVSFKDGQSSDKVLNSVGLEGRVQAIELFDSNNSIYLIKLDVDLENILKICRNLYESGFCKFAEPSFFREMKAHNPYYANQWGLKNTGQYGGIIGIDINAEQAWSVTKGNSNIKVAVIDEGVDLTHPDLQANLLQGYDATVNAPGGANGSPWSSNAHGTSCAGIVASCDNNIGVLGVASKVKIIPIRIAYDYSNNGLWTTNDVWIVNGIK